MSTDSPSETETLAGWHVVAATALAVAGLAARPIRAADVEFRPSVGLAISRDGNVAIIGDATGNTDYTATLAADIVVERNTPASALDFTYRPVYVTYRENDDLSYFGQSARLLYSLNRTERTRFALDVTGSRTQRQGVSAFRPENPVTLVVRTTETRAEAGVGATVAVSPRSVVDWRLRGGLNEFDGGGLQDDVFYGGTCAWRFETSARSSIGVGIGVDAFNYRDQSNVYTGSLNLVGSYQLGPLTKLGYTAGVSESKSDDTSATDFSGELTIKRTLSEVSELNAGIRQFAGTGSGLGGASLDRGLYASYRYTAERRGLEGAVLAGLWQREGLSLPANDTGTTNTWNGAGTLGWAFNRFLAIGLALAYSDQGAKDGAPDSLQTSYGSYGFWLRWAIRGR